MQEDNFAKNFTKYQQQLSEQQTSFNQGVEKISAQIQTTDEKIEAEQAEL